MAVCPDHDLCIEVTTAPDDNDTILIRETEDPDPERIVTTSRKNWLAFVKDVKDDKFDNV